MLAGKPRLRAGIGGFGEKGIAQAMSVNAHGSDDGVPARPPLDNVNI
jgi:hypothetical protein